MNANFGSFDEKQTITFYLVCHICTIFLLKKQQQKLFIASSKMLLGE